MEEKQTSALSAVQQKNLQYFKKQLNNWLSDPVYKYKYLIIHGEKVQGAYDKPETAFREAVASLPQGEFIIQQVIDDKEVVNFLSRAF